MAVEEVVKTNITLAMLLRTLAAAAVEVLVKLILVQLDQLQYYAATYKRIIDFATY
ncbi:MAG: hypothetical protein ACRC36_03660 [Lacrimispora sphenoides]